MSELDDIRARRSAITPGVWSASWAWGKSGGVYNAWAEAPFTSGTCLEDVAPQAEADAAFIAAAPGDVDALLRMVDAITAERDALAAQLAQAQRELAAQNPDWTKAPNLAKWWAVDEDGTAHWYWTEPTMGKHGWFVRGNSAYCNVTSQSAGHVELIGRDWWDTLRQRPQN